MYILEKIQRTKEMKELLKNLCEKKFILEDGKFRNEKIKINDLTTLSDKVLISIIKNYDSLVINSTDILKEKTSESKFQTNSKITEVEVRIIKEILFTRVVDTIKIAQSIVNQEIIDISYNEMLQIKFKLQFYIINVINDEELINLYNELNSILVKKENKKYEKTRLSI